MPEKRPFTLEPDPTIVLEPKERRRGPRTTLWRRMLAALVRPHPAPEWEPDPRTPEDTRRAGGLAVRRYRLPLPPQTPARIRIAFFSDLHWDRRLAGRKLPLAETVNEAAPDWILFGGDLTRFLESAASARELLARMTARRGKLAVLGNWERRHTWRPVSFWRTLYRSAGFRLLVNEACTDTEPGQPVFVGNDDPRHGTPACERPERRAADGFVVRLTHSPDAAAVPGTPLSGNLILAGHTHAGQIRLPGFGALYTSSRFGKTFEYGWYRRRPDGARLYVTAGVGCTGWAPLRRRILCRPELVILDLTRPIHENP